MEPEPMDLDPKALDEAFKAFWEDAGGTTDGVEAAIRAYLAAASPAPRTLPPEPPPGFVRVRIAAAANETGDWCCHGARDTHVEDAVIVAVDSIGGDRPRVSFITADVPLPEPPAEVVGSVES